MAFFDFLNRGVGGMTPAQTQPGVMGEGDITTQPPRPIGPTYGDIMKAALAYGSKPGSSGPAFASSIPRSGWQQRPMQPLSPNASPQAKKALGQDGGEQDDTLNEIARFLAGIFGVGA